MLLNLSKFPKSEIKFSIFFYKIVYVWENCIATATLFDYSSEMVMITIYSIFVSLDVLMVFKCSLFINRHRKEVYGVKKMKPFFNKFTLQVPVVYFLVYTVYKLNKMYIKPIYKFLVKSDLPFTVIFIHSIFVKLKQPIIYPQDPYR